LVSGFHSAFFFLLQEFYPARNEERYYGCLQREIFDNSLGFALNYVMFWKRNFIKLFGAVEGINQAEGGGAESPGKLSFSRRGATFA